MTQFATEAELRKRTRKQLEDLAWKHAAEVIEERMTEETSALRARVAELEALYAAALRALQERKP